ncbi:neurotensin receptor type 1 isoform A [Patagioenas fasciata monilis]|uniref:Neurotensin receptor type 1 isoform A n=1 Tax=Patagioenas fasciata monilis TaxID=372326 RepID=A0A1V4KKG3_PATFA|nr:neurotensin receptor type 1 isoform A [Patagioenas fasciata monilis]
MHLNATAPAVPGGPPHLHPAGYANGSNRSDLLPKAPDEEDLDVNTDIYSKVMVTVIYLALFLVGTVGNSITAYTLVRKKSLQNLQSTVHYHLASLAFSDLLIFLLCMPIELYNFIWVHHPWAFGGAVCKGYYFLRDACTYATALNIASLSVERYMAICHPFKAKSIMSRSRTKKFISCIWIASFLLAIPMIFTMGEIYGKDQDPDSLICTTIVDASTLKTVIQVRIPAAGAPGATESGQPPLSPGSDCQTLRRRGSRRGRLRGGERLGKGGVPGGPNGADRPGVRDLRRVLGCPTAHPLLLG